MHKFNGKKARIHYDSDMSGSDCMNDKKYGLYKRIMKRDPKAIDDIESLEEAKDIIKMIIGSTQGLKLIMVCILWILIRLLKL